MSGKLDISGAVRRAYDERVSKGFITADPAQIKLTGHMDQLIQDMSVRRPSFISGLSGWLSGKRISRDTLKSGLYIWGGVGRGKTYLMDMFFSVVDVSPKRRVHFNNFIQDVHQRIHDHRQLYKAGRTRLEDPVPPVAKWLAKRSSLLCLDEFSVSDIADAMLSGRLFTALFNEGITIVFTSNVKPEDLYKEGLNRQLFLPFIDLLLSRTNEIELASNRDYRLSGLADDNLYYWPLNEQSEQNMEETWNLLIDSATPNQEVINLKGRMIKVLRTAKGVARFSFDQLCREPRGVSDYLAIASRYSVIMIDDIPVLQESERNEAKRFILLIDVLYDNRIRLIVSADAPPNALCQVASGREAFEFRRTASRLIEMQSLEYNDRCS